MFNAASLPLGSVSERERTHELPYRLFRRRNGMYFIEDRFTKRQASLRTKDKRIAARILNTKNEAQLQPAISREIAKAYWMAGDPLAASFDENDRKLLAGLNPSP